MSPSPSKRCADRRPVRRAALIALSLLALLARPLTAQDAPATVPVDLLVDGRHAGTVDAVIEDGTAAIDRAALAAILAAEIRDEALAGLEGDGTISLDGLAALGIHASYDPAALSVHIHVPAALRRLIVIDVTDRGATRPGPVEAPARFSGYLNLWATAELATGSAAPPAADWAVPVSLGLQPVLNLAGWVLEARAALSTGLLPGSVDTLETRLDTLRLVKDLPGPSLRIAAGSLFLPVVGFQVSRSLYGVEVIRDPSLFEDGSAAGSLGFELALESPATVSVALNGSPLRTWGLAGGRYRLGGLPLAAGINTIVVDGPLPGRLVIPWDPRLLAAGETAFALGLGVGTDGTYDPLVSGWLRHGLGSFVTGSIELQAGLDRQVAGAQILLATTLGSLYGGTGLALSGLGTAGGATVDASAFLQYRLAFAGNPLLPLIGLEIRWTGPGFLAPGADDGDPTAWLLTGSLSQALPLGFGLAAGISTSLGHPSQPDSLAASLSLSHPVGSGAAISLVLAARASTAEPLELSGSLTLTSASGDGRRSASVGTALADGSTSADLRARAAGDGPAISASLDGYGGAPGASGSLGIQLAVPRLEAEIADQLRAGGADGTGNRVTASAATALVMADGVFAISRPVSDSFAIVVPAGSLAGELVVASAGSGGGEAESRHGSPGVLRQLTANRPVPVVLSAPEAPAGADIGEAARTLAPTYRSGYALRVGGSATVYAEGTLVTPEGAPLAWRAGTIARADAPGAGAAPFFTDDRGVFQAYGLEPGAWMATVDGPEGWSAPFSVPEGTAGLLALGTLRVAGATEGQ